MLVGRARRPSSQSRAVTTVREAVLSLVLPRDCAGCARADQVLCARCTRAFSRPWRCEEDATLLAPLPGGAPTPPWPVWTLAEYRGAARHAVLAWKSGVRPDLAPVLRGVVAAAAPAVLAELAGDGFGGTPVGGRGPLAVVPAPSGLRRRASGRFVVGELADAVAEAAARAWPGCEVMVLDVLRGRGRSGHRLSAVARGRRGGLASCAPLPPGLACLLVDDVVTTGATLIGCRDALRAAGARPLGALTLAATPPPGAPARPVAEDAGRGRHPGPSAC